MEKPRKKKPDAGIRPDNLNTVKIGRDDHPGYHHGDLRTALLDAAESVLAERGVDGFSLREAARRAGVSPAAPKHHFGDVRGLLTAIATRAYDDLAGRLEQATRAAPATRAERIRAQGRAYVQFAIDEPARFDLMWRRPLLDTEQADYVAAGQRAFAQLDRLVRGVENASPQDLETDLAPTLACWTVVHGFARLLLDGAFGSPAASIAPEKLDRLVDAVLLRLEV